MPQTVVVLGVRPDISTAILRSLAGRRLSSVLLAGRNEKSLQAAAEELRALSVAKVETERLDVTRIGTLEAFADAAARRVGHIDLVLIAAGELGTADLTALDAPAVASLATTNFTGPAAVITAFARVLCAQGDGRIVVLSSVAGYRVRAANFVYGATKAGLDGFALGLADALAGSGVEVMVVRPGYVRTKMTAGLRTPPFAIDAPDVAAAVIRGLETGAAVVWAPSWLRYVFGILRLAPRSIWRRVPG